MTIFFYFSINLMMVMGLAPVVGIPLPLMSFGGSAVMTVMFCLGLLMTSSGNNGQFAVELTGFSSHAGRRRRLRAATLVRGPPRPASPPVGASASSAWTHSSVGRAADS